MTFPRPGAGAFCRFVCCPARPESPQVSPAPAPPSVVAGRRTLRIADLPCIASSVWYGRCRVSHPGLGARRTAPCLPPQVHASYKFQCRPARQSAPAVIVVRLCPQRRSDPGIGKEWEAHTWRAFCLQSRLLFPFRAAPRLTRVQSMRHWSWHLVVVGFERVPDPIPGRPRRKDLGSMDCSNVFRFDEVLARDPDRGLGLCLAHPRDWY